MSTILDKLKQTGAAMDDAAIRDQLGLRLKQAAIKAMMAGIGKKDWNEYMSLFADNSQQLNRLTVPVENEDPWLPEARAYIVANAICGADSTTQTFLRVDALIDDDLKVDSDQSIVDPAEGQAAANGVIVRPFRIPKV